MAIAVFIDLVNRITGEFAHFEGEGLIAASDAMSDAQEQARGWIEWHTPDDWPTTSRDGGAQLDTLSPDG
tara:strand:+ start:2738 stop:2947 length:210 start_codon:yes stop_codon:yes gene_type:complete